MREPTILTLAVTVIVPLTVEPDAGDAMVTIRLPGGGSICATARVGAKEAELTISNSAAA